MAETLGIKQILKDYFRDDLQIANLGDEESLLKKNILDSTGVLEMISFIVETFYINVKDREILPENLDSLNKIEEFIKIKLGTINDIRIIELIRGCLKKFLRGENEEKNKEIQEKIDTLTDSASLFISCTLNEKNVMEFANELENRFDITLEDGEITKDNFISIGKIAKLVRKKLPKYN